MKSSIPFFFLVCFSATLFSQTIAGGGGHIVAICPDSTLRSWGLNNNGQLGDSTTTLKTTPIPVHTSYKFIALGGGVSHSIALKTDGTVWTWGSNADAQLGDSTLLNSMVPLQVHGPGNIGFLSGIRAISCGHLHHHNLAIKNDSTVWAWGFNMHGQLGDSTMINRRIPVKVYNLKEVTAVAVGDIHSLALKSDSTVWAWGLNPYGQLGDSSLVKKIIPVQTYSLSGITAITAGEMHSLALRKDSTVWGWGYNFNGELGNGTNTTCIIPTQITALAGIVAIAAGTSHSLALKSDSTVWAWGLNYNGQLGDSTTTSQWSPVKVKGLSGVTEISCGELNSYARKKDGSIWAWGMGTFGQLSNGTTGYAPCNCSVIPVQVNGPCYFPVDVEEKNEDSAITVYPNPTRGTLSVQTSEFKNTQMKIYNVYGECIHQSACISANQQADLSAQPNGMYILQLKTAHGTMNKKVIIQH